MRPSRLVALPVLLAALALPAAAQDVGSTIPALELEGYSQTEAQSFDDLFGRAVLIEFFAFWWGPCASSVPHLNELHEQFEAKGLTILGVTKESVSQTEPWIQKHEAAYPYAYDKGGKVQRFFGVGGIPHAILLDPTGKVVWRGHPATLDAKTVEASLAGALTRPLYSWPSAAKSVAKAVVKGDWAGALEEAGKLSADDGGPGLVEELRGMIDGRLAAAEAALEAGDYYGALERGEGLVKGLKGLPEQERAQRVLDGVEQHPDSKQVLKAQEKIRKVRSKEPSKRKEIEKAIDEMKDIIDDLPGSFAAQEASAYLEQLREKLRR